MYADIMKRQLIAKSDQEVFGYEVDSPCSSCGHQSPDNPVTCNAFPEGIPMVILLGKIKHENPFEGDNGLRWVPKDGPEPEDSELKL